MIDDNEEDGDSVIDPLDGGSGDDFAGAAGTAGLEVGDERLAHLVSELGLEVGRAERQDPVDVGVDPSGVEGGDGSGEVLDEADLVGVGAEPGIVPADGVGDPEAGQSDASRQSDAGGDGRADDTSDHGETLPRRRLATYGAAAVLAVIGLVAFLVAGSDDDASGRQEALAFSEDFINVFTSYDYESFDETREAIEAASSQGFASRYTSLLGGTGFVDALVENESSATSEIQVGPLLATFTENEARTFAIVNQQITGNQFEEPQATRLRVEVLMIRTPDGWVVVDVETT